MYKRMLYLLILSQSNKICKNIGPENSSKIIYDACIFMHVLHTYII